MDKWLMEEKMAMEFKLMLKNQLFGKENLFLDKKLATFILKLQLTSIMECFLMENIKEKVILLVVHHSIREILVKEGKKAVDGKNLLIKVNIKANISMISLMDMEKSRLISISIKDYSNLEDLMVTAFRELNNINI